MKQQILLTLVFMSCAPMFASQFGASSSNGSSSSSRQIDLIQEIMKCGSPNTLIDAELVDGNVQGDDLDWRVNPIPEEMHAQSQSTLARVRARRQNEMQRGLEEVSRGVYAPIYTDRPDSTLTIDGQNN